jgi:molybdopterin-guanine dinucleotide biosynthesis protein A
MVDATGAAGFVLTGGQSRRMGRDKALLELAGQPLALRVAAQVQPVVAELSLVGSPERYGHLGLPVLADCEANRGPLAGIVTALRDSHYKWNLVVACDMPYVETRLLEFLLQQVSEEADAVVPFVENRWQPLCAVYHRRALPVFEQVLAEGHAKIALALEQIRVRAVGKRELERFAFPAELLKNMNTPEEYAEAQRRLEVR